MGGKPLATLVIGHPAVLGAIVVTTMLTGRMGVSAAQDSLRRCLVEAAPKVPMDGFKSSCRIALKLRRMNIVETRRTMTPPNLEAPIENRPLHPQLANNLPRAPAKRATSCRRL